MTQMFSFDEFSNPLAPGQMLNVKLLEGMHLSQSQLAHAIGISRPRLNMILKGRCQLTAEIALRIERVFNISPTYWMRIRDEFELFEANQRIAHELQKLPRLADRHAQEQSAWRACDMQAAA